MLVNMWGAIDTNRAQVQDGNSVGPDFVHFFAAGAPEAAYSLPCRGNYSSSLRDGK